VFRFFVTNPMLDTSQYGPIVDYLCEQKFISPPGEHSPRQPNLSMKGRSPEALLRQVEGWHARLGRIVGTRSLKWDPHPTIQGMRFFARPPGKRKDTPEAQVEYRVVQLLNAAELGEEGRRMCHCVASYARSCAANHVSIWSIRRLLPERTGYVPLCTIEVRDSARQVVQARTRRNELPTPRAWSMLEQWVRAQGLSISSWVGRGAAR